MKGIGKLPPQDQDAERAILGSLLQFKDVINDVIDKINENDFYNESHKMIFSSITNLYARSNPVDILTVTDDLRKSGNLEKSGGPFYITELTDSISGSSNTEYHCRIIKECSMRRALISIGFLAGSKPYDDSEDIFELLDEIGSKLIDIDASINTVKSNTVRKVMPEVVEKIKSASKTLQGVTGIHTGYLELDKITGGWQNSNLILIAARPSMGKTDVGINLSVNAAMKGKKTALFSLEMSKVEVTTRVLTCETELKRDKIKSGKLNDSDWQKVSGMDEKVLDNIFIQDNPSLNTMQFRSICKKLKMKEGIDLIVVDYLQLMSGIKKNVNKVQEVGEISRTLKLVAMELNVPVIAICQLSRSVETRGGDKIPMLSDLRESGDLEQDANIVIFPYRPIYYGFDTYDDIIDTKKLMVMIFAKNRDGRTGECYLTYDDTVGKIWDYLDDQTEEVKESEVYHTSKFKSNGYNDFESKDPAPF